MIQIVDIFPSILFSMQELFNQHMEIPFLSEGKM
jgi:hypothetical protein